MDKIPMWIQKAIAIFIIYVVVIVFSTYLTGDWRILSDLSLRNDEEPVALIIIGIPFSLAVSWLIENIKRK